MTQHKTTQPNQPNQPVDVSIFYDRNAVQRIPLDSIDNGVKSRSWHHLKPLLNERYFQLENEIEAAKAQKLSVREMLEPKHKLWRELFVKREGFKEKDENALFFEGVQAVNALLYYEPTPARDAAEGELLNYEADDSIYFGAMYSGAWLGLKLFFKGEFSCNLEGYREATKPIRRLGLIRYAKNDVQRIYEFALPYLTKTEGYQLAENIVDAVPAWHVINAADDMFSGQMELLTKSPVITKVYGQ